ncbi:hypothetical protein EI94DRAFT_1707720 [Lactarius quietus]|nr:hypothetical protein EI94DRAFT_1707720 [Lactarius quietus]
MEANKRQPKMSLAIHHPDGTKILSQEYSKIRRSVDLIMKKLITTVDSNPRTAVHGSLPRTKTFLRKWFLAEYDQAILELEAQQTILHLCSAHWKADTLIRQMLLQRSETGSKDTPRNVASANSAPMAPTNIAPMALQPQVPLALHVQKRSKDEAALTQQKTTSSITAYNLQRPAAPKLVPSFLSHTEPISVDPSGASTTHLQRRFLTQSKSQLIISLWSFMEGEPFENVATLLEHVQLLTLGYLILMRTTWVKAGATTNSRQVASACIIINLLAGCGSIATAFKLVAAAIETCQEARLMDTNTTTPQAG